MGEYGVLWIFFPIVIGLHPRRLGREVALDPGGRPSLECGVSSAPETVIRQELSSESYAPRGLPTSAPIQPRQGRRPCRDEMVEDARQS